MLDERIDMTVGDNTSLGVTIASSHTATEAVVIIDGDFGPVILRLSRSALLDLGKRLAGIVDSMDHYYERPVYRIVQDEWAMPQRDGSFIQCDGPTAVVLTSLPGAAVTGRMHQARRPKAPATPVTE